MTAYFSVGSTVQLQPFMRRRTPMTCAPTIVTSTVTRDEMNASFTTAWCRLASTQSLSRLLTDTRLPAPCLFVVVPT